jgi:hypothetical protein
MKDSFVFYRDWKKAIEDLPNNIRLEIYECIIEYATTGSLQELKPLAKVAFNFIKTDIDRNTTKYMSIVERNRTNGSKGGRPKKKNPDNPDNPDNPVGFRETRGKPEKPQKPDYDNVNDHDHEIISSNEDTGRDKPRPISDETQHVYLSEMQYFIASFNAIRGTKFQAIRKVREQFNARLKEGFSSEQMLQALRNAMQTDYHIKEGYRYLTPEFFTRPDKIEMYLNSASANSSKSFEEKILEQIKQTKNGNK